MPAYTKNVAKGVVFEDPAGFMDSPGTFTGSSNIVDPAAVTVTTADGATFRGADSGGNDSFAFLESNSLIGAVNLTAARKSTIEIGVLASDGAMGAVTATGASGSSIEAYVQATGAIGALTAIANGRDTDVYVSANALGTTAAGHIGAINVQANGFNSDSDLDASAYAGNVGAVTVTARAEAYASAWVYADAITAGGAAQGGNIGAVTVKATGANADASAYVEADGVFNNGGVFKAGGNIGALTVVATGFSASANIAAEAYSGGSIGAITVTASGTYASANASAWAGEGGNVGAITMNITGMEASGQASAYASAYSTGGGALVGGNIGAISLKVQGDDASGHITADASGVFSNGEVYRAAGNIGAISLSVTGYEATAEIYASAYSGGNIGAVTVNNTGDDSSAWVDAFAYSGSIGAITINNMGYSAYSNVSAHANAVIDAAGVARGGSIGAITLNVGDSGYVLANISTSGVFSAGSAAYAPGTAGNIGAISLTLKDHYASGVVYATALSGGNIGAITVNGNSYEGSAFVDLYAEMGSIGAITMNLKGSYVSGYVEALASAAVVAGAVVGGGNIGPITVKVNGLHASAYVSADTYGEYTNGGPVLSAGNIGAIILSATGFSANVSGYFSAYSGGNIGSITVTADGTEASAVVYASAATGNIGHVTLTANGFSAQVSGWVSAGVGLGAGGVVVGGNIGNVTINAIGTYASAHVEVEANGYVAGGVHIGGGNVGNITQTVNGYSASGYIEIDSDDGGSIGNTVISAKGEDVESNTWLRTETGGDIGTVTVSLQAALNNANSGYAYVSAYVNGTASDVSKIGATTITVNNAQSYGNTVELDYDANSGSIGNITGTLTGGESGVFNIDLYADHNVLGGGKVGTITLTNTSEDSSTSIDIDASVAIGAITVHATGEGGSEVEIYLQGDADVGAITVNFGADHSGYAGEIWLSMDTTLSDVGIIKVTGGSAGSDFEVNGGVGGGAEANTIAGVDMSLFKGYSYIDLGGVSGGTSIKVGAADSDVWGTQGADKITGGAGVDIFWFDVGDSEVGTIGDSNKSITVANSDILYGMAVGDIINLSDALGTQANYDTFTSIGAGGSISLILGSATKVDQYTGVYDSATGKFVSSATLAADTASTTDVNAVMYMSSIADNTTGTQMVVVVGVATQTNGAIENGIITLAA